MALINAHLEYTELEDHISDVFGCMPREPKLDFVVVYHNPYEDCNDELCEIDHPINENKYLLSIFFTELVKDHYDSRIKLRLDYDLFDNGFVVSKNTHVGSSWNWPLTKVLEEWAIKTFKAV